MFTHLSIMSLNWQYKTRLSWWNCDCNLQTFSIVPIYEPVGITLIKLGSIQNLTRVECVCMFANSMSNLTISLFSPTYVAFKLTAVNFAVRFTIRFHRYNTTFTWLFNIYKYPTLEQWPFLGNDLIKSFQSYFFFFVPIHIYKYIASKYIGKRIPYWMYWNNDR